jgi:hypothetical protein
MVNDNFKNSLKIENTPPPKKITFYYEMINFLNIYMLGMLLYVI